MQSGRGNWWNRGRGGFRGQRGGFGFQQRFPNRGEITQGVFQGAVQCWRCGEFGHPARLCSAEQTTFAGGMPLPNASFGPARGSPRAGQGYSFNPGSICGHCQGQGHGRADCTQPGLGGQFHQGGRNRCNACIGNQQQQVVGQQPILTPQTTGSSMGGAPLIRDLGVVRDGALHRFVISGTIRAVSATPTPGRRSFWSEETVLTAEVPLEIRRYSIVSWSSLECEIARTSASSTTGTLSYGWFSSAFVPGGTDFTSDWVRNQWAIQRLQAASEAAGRGVTSTCDFEDERGVRRISRALAYQSIDSFRFAPTFVWDNDGTATYSVRYRFVLLCRGQIAN